jgi:hypothetical protein
VRAVEFHDRYNTFLRGWHDRFLALLWGRLALGAATDYNLSALLVRYITGFAVLSWVFALALTFGKETMREARKVAYLSASLGLLAVVLWLALRPRVELRFAGAPMVAEAGAAFNCALAAGVIALLVLLGDEVLLVAAHRLEATVVAFGAVQLALGSRAAVRRARARAACRSRKGGTPAPDSKKEAAR